MGKLTDILNTEISQRKREAFEKLDRLSGVFNRASSEVLDNGLRVQTKTKPGSKILKANVWINSGSSFDPEGKEGTAHMLEHMLFNSNKDMIGRRFEFEKRGGQIDAFTNVASTRYEFKLPDNRNNRAFLFETVSRMLFHPQIDPASLEEEKKVVLNEIMQGRDAGRENIEHKLVETAFGIESLSQDVTGPLKSMQSLTVDDLMVFHKAHYVPSNTTINIVGPDSTRNFYKHLKKNFSGLPKGERPMMPEHTKKSDYKGGEKHIEAPQSEQTNFRIAFSVPCGNSMSENVQVGILGNYINQSLMDKMRGVSDRSLYETGSHWNYYKGQTILVMRAGIMPESAGLILPAVSDILSDIAEGRIDADRLEMAKAKILRENQESYEAYKIDDFNFGNPLGQAWNHRQHNKIVQNVTGDNLTAAARRMLQSEPTLVTSGDISYVQSYDEFKALLPKVEKGITQDEKETPVQNKHVSPV